MISLKRNTLKERLSKNKKANNSTIIKARSHLEKEK